MPVDKITDPKLKQILEQLAKFGFQFFAFDESGVPLVKAPNNQVVQINLAIDFVNKQLAQASASGSPEAMPDINTGIAKAESGVETAIELEKNSIETASEKQDNKTQQATVQPIAIPAKAPKMQFANPSAKPYGDGFDPKSFDPTNIEQTKRYIARSAKASDVSSNKWLAQQFKKFLLETGIQV